MISNIFQKNSYKLQPETKQKMAKYIKTDKLIQIYRGFTDQNRKNNQKVNELNKMAACLHLFILTSKSLFYR